MIVARIVAARPAVLFAILMVAHVVAALALQPACVSIDEMTHEWMATGLAKTASWAVENGYGLARSTELESMAVRAVGGKLVSAYPYGLEIATLPLHAALGLRAFVVANAVAFVGTIALCHAIAIRVTRSRRIALGAAAIFALGSYAWDYALAIWPHACATFLTTAAFHQGVVACQTASARSAALRASAAGLLAGAAIAFRLDAAFIAAPILALTVTCASAPTATTACALAGTAPGVAFLAGVNHARFGSWAPFSYGPWEGGGSPTSGVAAYAPLAVTALAALGALAAWRAIALRASRVALAATIALAIAALASASVRQLLVETARGCASLLVDLRLSDPSVVEPGLARSPDGAMLYAGSIKKAWLQSLPYAPIAVLAPFLARAKRGAPFPFALLAAVACPVAAFCRFRWHGGLCFNLRYFLPTLPFVAILTAIALGRLAARAPRDWRVLRRGDLVAIFAVLAYLAALLASRTFAPRGAGSEPFHLDAPLAIAAAIALLASAAVALPRASRLSQLAAGAAFFATLVGLSWAATTTFSYDAPATRSIRARNHAVLEAARPFLGATKTLVVADMIDPFAELLRADVVVADGTRDGFADVADLVEAAACDDRVARAVVHENMLAKLERAAGERVAVEILDRPREYVVASLVARRACAR
jgi:hypothetical protein